MLLYPLRSLLVLPRLAVSGLTVIPASAPRLLAVDVAFIWSPLTFSLTGILGCFPSAPWRATTIA